MEPFTFWQAIKGALWWVRNRPIKTFREARKEARMKLRGKRTYIAIFGMAVAWVFGLLGIGDCTPEMVQEIGEAACRAPVDIAIDLADKLIFLFSLGAGLRFRYLATKNK